MGLGPDICAMSMIMPLPAALSFHDRRNIQRSGAAPRGPGGQAGDPVFPPVVAERGDSSPDDGGAVGFAPSGEIEVAIIAIGCVALTATFLFASAILTPGRPAFWWTVSFSAAALIMGLGLVIFRFGLAITLLLMLALLIFGDGIGTVGLLVLSFRKGGLSLIGHR